MRVLLVLLAALSLAAAGCGGGDDSSTTQAETATSTTDTTEAATDTTATDTTDGAASTTTVSMKEYSFDPSDLTVKQGASITVKNDGDIAHNLAVEKGSEKVAGTDTFLGGKSEKLTVDVTPGKYKMICTVPGHEDLGMKGDFTVTK